MPFDVNSVARSLTVRSAVNPCLWACAVISVPLFVLSSYTEGWRSVALFIIALLPVASFVVSYFYFMFSNPAYLRSEGYQLKMESLKLLGDRDNPLNAAAGDVVKLVNNPGLPQPPNSDSIPQIDHE